MSGTAQAIETRPAASGHGLEARVRKLEGERRWLRGALLAVVAASWLGAATSGTPPATAAAGTGPLELRDGEGRLRMVAAVYAGTPVLQLLDEDGEARLSLGLRLDQTPFFELSDEDGNARASVAVEPATGARLHLLDEQAETLFRVR